jgi:hypothetical protein
VTDRKPPRVAGDERATLLALLRYQRESLVRKVDGLTDEQAAWSPVPSGTSLRWLVDHLTAAEVLWVVERFAGEAAASVPPPATASLAEAVAAYRAVWDRVDAVVVAAPDLDAPCRRPPEPDVPLDLRWVLAHLLEETARHAGHADLIRELLDGSTGR